MKFKGFEIFYSSYFSYLFITGLFLMFGHVGFSSFATTFSEDIYISRDFTKASIFTGSRELIYLKNSLGIFRIPASTKLTLSNLEPDSNVRITDISGNILLKYKNNSSEKILDISN